MAIPLDPKEMVSFEELGGPTRCPQQVACGERNNQQGGIFREGESGGQRNEEKE